MKKNKLKSAEIGSVSFNFDKLGKITVLTDKDEDAMLEQAMEAGADDLEVSLCVYACLCVYVCMYVFMYICIYSIYICIYIYIYIYIHIY